MTYSFCPLNIIAGKEHYVFAQENLTGSGTFWARVYRTNEEEKCFVDAMKRMGLVRIFVIVVFRFTIYSITI